MIKFENIPITETISLITIGSIILTAIYKFGLYWELGIPLFTNYFSPSSLLISSLSFLVAVLVGVIGGVFLSYISEIKLKKFRFIGWIFMGVTCALVFLLLSNFYKIPNVHLYQIAITNTYLFFTLTSIYIMQGRLSLNSQLLITLFGILIFTFNTGSMEAKQILGDRNLNQIVLKDSKEKWFLIDAMNDKSIIMSLDGTKKFKLIESKDIEVIINKPK